MDDVTIPFANSGIDPVEYRTQKLRDLVLKLTWGVHHTSRKQREHAVGKLQLQDKRHF